MVRCDPNAAWLTCGIRAPHQTVLVNLADGRAIELAGAARPDTRAFAYDGTHVFLNQVSGGGLSVLRVRADDPGQVEEIYRLTRDEARAHSISPDHRILALQAPRDPGDIFIADLKSQDLPRVIVNSSASEVAPSLSPDGHWIAYTADAGHRREAYVRKVHEAALPIQISDNGGRHPIWSRDGTKLYYRTDANDILVVKIKSLEPPEFEKPVMFASGRFRHSGVPYGPGYDVFTKKDGDRLLMLKSVYDEPEPQGATQVTVLVNFDEYIRQKAGGKSLDAEGK